MNTNIPIEKQKITFENRDGQLLAALLEKPASEPGAYALFAHCFTCSKDIAAASRISRALAARGIAVLRFDFTGIGNSEGDFANTNFSSNVDDLVCAADYLREHLQAPALLIGHSLGGAAVLAAAGEIAEASAVVTIGAPADPGHVAHLFESSREQIESEGRAVVDLAGRKFEIKKQFLDDIESQSLGKKIERLRKALLIFHSPVDDIVGIDNASAIFQAARHPKSFVSLDKADHLLSKPVDSEYVAATISGWASRYVLGPETAHPQPRPAVKDGEVLVREDDRKFGQDVFTDRHHLRADEPESYGGADSGPSPYEYLMAGLGACTAMTVRMYASRKSLELERVSVTLRHDKIHATDCAECETKEGRIDRIERDIRLQGDLSDEERQRLMDIADRCPVHRTLHSEIDIRSRMV
ncbi:MAG: bifunctional alpha/beta hydrolase/OsmC family protein [Gammaproteobacteria bacterium]|nr:bifunctional alpha/beta hydrolase/OsmC family protein [Gammaproteobacteria bacterium]